MRDDSARASPTIRVYFAGDGQLMRLLLTGIIILRNTGVTLRSGSGQPRIDVAHGHAIRATQITEPFVQSRLDHGHVHQNRDRRDKVKVSTGGRSRGGQSGPLFPTAHRV